MYRKPEGWLLSDNKVICWGNSRDWKLILLAVIERAYHVDNGIAYAAVLNESGKTVDSSSRGLVSLVGNRLKISKVLWLN
jgi:hypothetical protein